ncbi:DUF1330 domain-containing protein [Cupriavidus gilardii]|uniref:DUF1330 domain-containing protein n=1 Tax=Cupriavidus gilardii TaxID=82541 RepID=UPI00157FFB17|nr:DUF1330 domain-containing protein [Cupriavidus gilardii]MCT9073595.1 DUF1330 domain-containing protein [Cupriavidus gilardii]QKS61407.1 DUF1330 domain-containing protein [Cupriavidus gilardii]
MAKGYWVAMVDIADMEGYQQYIAANKTVFEKFGARFLVRNGQKAVVEGQPRSRVVVLEFDSYQRALECYESPEYQALIALRTPYSQADLVVIEGYE